MVGENWENFVRSNELDLEGRSQTEGRRQSIGWVCLSAESYSNGLIARKMKRNQAVILAINWNLS